MPSVFQPACCPDESQCQTVAPSTCLTLDGRHHGATLPTKHSLPFSFSFCRAASAFQFPFLGSAGNLCGNSGESMIEVHLGCTVLFIDFPSFVVSFLSAWPLGCVQCSLLRKEEKPLLEGPLLLFHFSFLKVYSFYE